MIQINNGSQEYEIIERDVQYFYKLGLNLKVVNKLNEVNIVFPDRQTLRTAIDTLVKSMHRQIATIPALLLGAGIIYWINTPNVSAHSYVDNTITVEHQAGTLEIECINDIQAEHHNQHLEYNWQANHLDEYIANKRLIYVSPQYSNNDFTRKYSSWNNAINKARSGDVIIIEPGEYTISQLILKNNVDAIIKPGAVFNNTYVSQYGMFNCGQTTVNCRIFGEGVFNSEATTFYIDGDNSKVFIQFNEIHSNNTFTFYCDNGSVYAKGYYLGNYKALDTDGDCQLADQDVLYMFSNDDKGWFPDNNGQTYFYLRNAYMGIPSENLYMQNINGDYDITLVNSKLESAVGIHILGAGDDHIPDVVRIWGSEILADEPYLNTSGYDSQVYIYDDLTTSSPFPGSNFSFPNESPITDAGLTLENNERDGDWTMWEPGTLSYELDEKGFPVFTFDLIPNAIYYRIYQNNALVGECNYYEPSIKLGYKLTGDVSLFRYEGIRNTATSNLSNFILTTNIMALTNKPKPAKYDIGDTVYYNNAGSIETFTIKAKRIIVKNETGNATGEQYNYYQFNENYSEIIESKLFAGKGSLLAAMKGDFLNDVKCDTYRELSYDISNPNNHKIDGMDYTGVDFTALGRPISGEDYNFTGSYIDWCNFQNATLPTTVEAKDDLIDAVGSYDKKTTLFTDGYPIKDWNGIVFSGTPNTTESCLVGTTGTISINLKSVYRIKYDDWTFTFATGGSASVAVNTETRTVAITYVSATTTTTQLSALLNASSVFKTYFNDTSVTNGSNVVNRTTDFTYYAYERDDITSLDLTDLDCETTDFHYAIMPTNADTKAEFKALVNAWDPVTTIWTDGEPIGE